MLLSAIQFVAVLATSVMGFFFKQCPELNTTQDISYSEIKGNWITMATYPASNQKCKNSSFYVTAGDDLELRQDYYEKFIFTWGRFYNEYKVLGNFESPSLELKKKSFPYPQSTYTLLGGKFNEYMILYKCSNFLLFIKEQIEIWTREGVEYKNSDIPQTVATTLRSVSLNHRDLTFRQRKDCFH